MTARKTSENVKQLEQLAFNAGMDWMMQIIRIQAGQTTKNEVADIRIDPIDNEVGLEEWRQLAIVRSLESQIMSGE